MATSLELWRSDTGSIEDGSFHLIDSLPDAPFAINDLNVVPGQLYIYRARRYDTTLLAYSAWSALAFAVAPVPQGVSHMNPTYTGYQSKMGIGREGPINTAAYGNPVLAQKLLDRQSGQLDMDLDVVDHEQLIGITADIEGLPGISNVTGTPKINLTPEGFSRLLQAGFGDATVTAVAAQVTPAAAATVVANGGGATGGLLAAGAYFLKFTIVSQSGETAASPESAAFTPTAGQIPQVTLPGALTGGLTYNIYLTPVGGASGSEVLYATGVTTATFNLAVAAPASTVVPPATNGATAAYSQLVFKDSFLPVSQTISEVRGPSFLVHPGSLLNGLTLNVDKTQKQPVQLDCEVVALNQIEYDTEAAIGTNAVGVDPLTAYAAVEATTSIGGIVVDAKTVNLAIKWNRQPKDVLNGNRGPAGHYRQKTEVSGTIGIYFEDTSLVAPFFGQLAAQAKPFGAKKKVMTSPIVIRIDPPANGLAPNGFVNSLIFNVPRATIKKLTRAVNGQEAIMQQIEFKGYFDLVSATPVGITLYNTETNAALTTAGTPLTHVPANDVQSLTY